MIGRMQLLLDIYTLKLLIMSWKGNLFATILLQFIWALNAQLLFWANFTASSQYAGSTAQHTYLINFGNFTYTGNSYIYINYTSNWNLNSLTYGSVSDFCENDCTIGSATATPTGQNVRLDNLMPTGQTGLNFNIGYTLKNIVLPLFAETDTISIRVFDNLGVTLNTTTININVYANLMQCTATPTSNVVSATTSYSFTVTPNAVVPLLNSGYLTMVFPAQWSNSAATPALSYASCSNGLSIVCNASGNSVKATGLFTGVSTIVPFTFTLNNIVNPGSEQPNRQLQFIYYYANGSSSSYCQVPISGLVSPSLADMTFSLSNNFGTVIFTTLFAPFLTDQIILTLPSQIYMNNSFQIYYYINNGVRLPLVPVIITGLNQISLIPFKSTNLINLKIELYSIWIVQPLTTPQITVSLRRNGYQYTYGTCCNQTLASAQTMVSSTKLANYQMKQTTNYLFTVSFIYYSFSYLLIDFCSPFTLTTNAQYSCYFTSTISASLLNCRATSNSQIQLALLNSSALFSTYLGYQSSYEIVVIGITNPSQLNCTATISSYSAANVQLEYSNSPNISYISVKILNAQVTVANPTVGATSTYTFAINNTNNLLANSIMHIYFPPPFSLSNVTCTINGISTLCPNISSSYIRFTLPAVPISQYNLYPYALNVMNVINPPSLRPTSSFTILLESGSAIVEGVTEGITVAMITLANFSNLTVTPSNYLAGALSSYSIFYLTALPIPTGSVATLNFQLPNQYKFVNCTACSSHQTFTLGNTSSTLVVSNIYNPQTTTSSSLITVSLLIDGFLAIQDTTPSVYFTSSTLAYTLSSNSSFLGEACRINITVSYLPIKTTYLIITIPPQYYINNISVSTDGTTSLSFNLSSYTLNLTISSINFYNTTFYLSGLTNPNSTNSSAWSLSAQTSAGIIIATSTSSITFIAACGSVCKECVNSSYCTSCYNNSLVNSLPYFDSVNHYCIIACPSTQFAVNLTCFACNSSCLSCAIFSSNCTSCAGTYLLNGQCLNQCPSNYYQSGTNCSACLNNCQTCNSSSTCLSCSGNYILQNNNTCALNCSYNQYNFSKVCTNCPTNCSTCDASGCISCDPGNLLVQLTTKICTNQCPQGYYISSNNSICEICQTPCLTCSVHSNNCTSCNSSLPNKFYYNLNCNTTCPALTYTDELNQCQQCTSNCGNCTSATNCSSCLSPFLFYNYTNQCVATCFSNTINVSNSCERCTSNCLMCSISVSNCTACIETYFLLNNTCVTSCGLLIAANGVCSSCYFPCLFCNPTNLTNCSSCVTNYTLFNFACYTSCPYGTYLSSAANCSLCNPSCATCSGLLNCSFCYAGYSLLNNTCYSSCPLNYFSYLGNCTICQPQCTNCSYDFPYQCTSCNSPYYWNPITYECKLTCSHPFYLNTSSNYCELCSSLCKTCAVYITACSSCDSSTFLFNMACILNCPTGYYGDSLNQCQPCGGNCASCDSQNCYSCISNTYFYQGVCYATCPASAPNIYQSYCRNCLKINCVLCNSANQCVMCINNNVNYNGDCLSQCPNNYEPDLLTGTRCILKATAAYLQYIAYLQKDKILALPSSVLLLLSMGLLWFSYVKLFTFAFLLAAPQTLCLVQLAVNYYEQAFGLAIKIPNMLVFICLGVHVVISVVQTVVFSLQVQKRTAFMDWYHYGSNSFRCKLVIVCSFFNKQTQYLLFSGLFNLPFTSFPYTPDNRLRATHILYIIFLQAPILALTLFIVVFQKTYAYNNKLFYSAIDAVVVFAVTIVFDLFFIVLAANQADPPPYEKYILPNVSGQSLPPYSDYNDENLIEEVDPNNVLHRSNSDEDMFESAEVKAIIFKSELDPNDFFDDPPNMDNEQIPDALEKGDFRKKNKKKRGRKRDGLLDLGVIREQDEDSNGQHKLKKNKKPARKLRKAEDIGGLKDFVYWKKPKEKKPDPGKVFRSNQKSIMERIREKQSEFDTITQNDVVFREEQIEDSSSNEEYNIQNESRRALQTNYSRYFNLHYAERQHLT